MEWQELETLDKNELWEDLQKYISDYPGSTVLLEKFVEFLRWKRFHRIDTALTNEKTFSETSTYCSALDYVAGRLRELIRLGKKGHDEQLQS